MGKWFGKIGYSIDEEVAPGVWEPNIVEREYYGELVRNTNRKLQTSDDVNDNINISNNISIVSDPFANDHFANMLYIEFMGTKWKISEVEVSFPRLILTLGGVYNGITRTVTD